MESYKMKNHKQIHREKEVKCGMCDAIFIFNSGLRRHMKHVHEGKPYETVVCELCGKEISYTGYYNHKRIVHFTEADKGSYVCDKCGKMFDLEANLKIHLYTIHGVKKMIKPQYNKSKKVKIENRSKKAKGQTSYTCDVCNKILSTRESWKAHKRTHTGEKPFKCEECGKCFIRKTNLKTHSVVHTKIKKHLCKFCPKAFTQHGSLKIHCKKNHPPQTS